MLYLNVIVQMNMSLAAFSLLPLSRNGCVNFSSVTSCLNVKCTFPGAINCHYFSLRFQFLQKFTYFNHNQKPVYCHALSWISLQLHCPSYTHYILHYKYSAEVIMNKMNKETNVFVLKTLYLVTLYFKVFLFQCTE